MQKSKMLKTAGGVLAGVVLHAISISPANAQTSAQTERDDAIAATPPVAAASAVRRSRPVEAATAAVEIKTPNLEQTKQHLRERAAYFRATAVERRQALLNHAAAIGAPLHIYRGAEQGVATLADITEEGEPIYLIPNNVAAAATIGVTELWPTNSVSAIPLITGQSGLNLSGSNQVVGMWEVDFFAGSASVQTNHDQFMIGGNSRIIQADEGFSPSAGISPHATAVAGTLASAGITQSFNGLNLGNWSKGAAFRATVRAFAFESGLNSTFSEEAANGLRTSNHSYSRQAGWAFDGTDWIWFGVAATNAPEDWKFGAYAGSVLGEESPRSFDDNADSAPSTLMVLPAADLMFVGPGQAVQYYLSTDPNKTSPQTATRDWINGDDGGFDSLAPNGCAKNVLTVSGVYTITPGYSNATDVVLEPISSSGPTDDGRIKPEIVAAGIRSTATNAYNPLGFDGFVTTVWDPAFSTWTSNYALAFGTSFSAPSVAGGLALVLERRGQIRSEWTNNPYPIRSSTLRALAVHTANQAGTNAGPSYKFGYGLFDAANAVNLMAADAVTGAANGAKPYVKEVFLPSSQKIEFKVQATNSSVPIKVTLAWTDPPGTAQTSSTVDQTTRRLVNDLDLRIISPAGTTNLPWILNPDLTNKTASARGAAATTGDDSRNNLEQVVVNSPSTGTNDYYIVRVTHKGNLGVEGQWASLTISGTSVPTVSFVITEFEQQEDGSFIITWSAVVGGIYILQTASSVLGPWSDASEPISANLESMSLLIPPPSDPQGLYRFIRVY